MFIFNRKLINHYGNTDKEIDRDTSFEDNDSGSDNVFKSLSTFDKDCYFLNSKCNRECYCDKDKDNNIRRICFDKTIFNYETFIYLSLLKRNADITSMISFNKNDLLYITKDYISLRIFLLNNPNHTSLIINEVFAFINTFKKYNFIHGNLHIDNIFVDINNNYKFHIIDLCNSYYNTTDCSSNSSDGDGGFKRTSFIDIKEDNGNGIRSDNCGGGGGRNENDISFTVSFKEKNLIHWDFLSLFISLKLFFDKCKWKMKKRDEYINYTKSTITNYIGKNKLDDALKYYNYYINSTENESCKGTRIKYYSI